MKGNFLNSLSIDTHIPTLQSRGVTVQFDNITAQPEDIAQTVDIPDPNLRAEIENLRGKTSGATITVADMLTLTRLSARNANISDLTGLESATNLTTLYLDAEYVWTEERSINSNSVSDLSPLAGLTNLTRLALDNNNITDISPLAGLTSLTRLWIYSNAITDISAVAGLTNLTYLGLGGNNISDISPLEGLTNLTRLALDNNNITDISPVAGLTSLTRLWIYSNAITDISAVAGLTNLTYLGLGGNNISDISPLEGLTNLTRLTLNNNSISDVSAVAGLTNLTYLGLGGNNISDISPLEGLTNLTELPLWENPLSNISPLAGLTNLTTLWLYNNSISDISAVAGLTNLTTLWLYNNSISDLSPIAGLNNLTVLRLEDNNISDLSPLVANTRLGRGDRVDVSENPLSYGSIHAHIPIIQSRGVEIQFDDSAVRTADVNSDGIVDVLDLVLVASMYGNKGQNLAPDVNSDGIVDVLDLVLVAGMFGNAAAAPSTQPQAPEILTAAAVQQWLTDARSLEVSDPIVQRGLAVLQQLLASLIPTETKLLANYPNPFNPETWIPYRLAEDAFVILTIYDLSGQVVRTIDVGHQTAAVYESRSKVVYWDGGNEVGEQVASGLYFYHLSAGDYSATRKMLIVK